MFKKHWDLFQQENNTLEAVWESFDCRYGLSIDFLVLMVVSVMIASFGLLLNSSAVIIGAMIIAPLMDPLLALSLASISNHTSLKLHALLTLLLGVLLGLAVSFTIGLAFSFMGESAEMLARTEPTMLDLFVALASGFIGGYAKVRRPIASSAFGAAIAISLVPPLSVVGIGLAYDNAHLYTGAGLLFLTNVASVILSGMLAFLLLEFGYFKHSLKSLILPGFIILALAIPLSVSFYQMMEKRVMRNLLIDTLKSGTYTFRNLRVIQVEVLPYKSPVVVNVRLADSGRHLTQHQIDQVQAFLSQKVGRPVQLEVMITEMKTLRGHRNLKNDEVKKTTK
ncbi:MAG: DUF389 domain-containing protein [Candidatus Melainabacteria bacterium]|nr:DUF389 domain-containing protein [Candidatus Melainabacteria bacterium]